MLGGQVRPACVAGEFWPETEQVAQMLVNPKLLPLSPTALCDLPLGPLSNPNCSLSIPLSFLSQIFINIIVFLELHIFPLLSQVLTLNIPQTSQM